MTRDLISKRTRTEFREFLVRWPLRVIGDEFASAHIACDQNYKPDVSGERRAYVEQHYHTLDFKKPADVRRLLDAYASIIDRAEREVQSSFDEQGMRLDIEKLKACLAKDGLNYDTGAIVAISPAAKIIFESERTISEVTRRAIFDELIAGEVPWWGRLSETDFLSRVCDLSKLPSHDPRFPSMVSDVWQHRENNRDWSDDWIFSDSRLDLLRTPDEVFLRFLSELVHPVVRPETDGARALVRTFNGHLAVDGWELVEGRAVSGKPTFFARRRVSGSVVLPDPTHEKDVLSDEYVRELCDKCDYRLGSGDLDGAVTLARTILEAILSELEFRITGARSDYKGDLPKQFKTVTKLLRMDEQRPDLDDRFKDVIRGLVMVANGLAPLRNKMSDGHARARKPAPHHARVVVNASKTVSAFLVESFNYQIKKGLVQVIKDAEGASAS